MMGRCDVCDAEEALRKGMCGRHYAQWRKTGNPRGFQAPGANYDLVHSPTVLETPCRLWMGGRNEYGYGIKSTPTRPSVRVHRWVWEQIHGPITPRQVLRHRCDNPPCFRYDHLILGTRKDNAQDMTERGRHAGARRHINKRLTSREVTEIRERHHAGESLATVAIAFNISIPHVSGIATGKSWKSTGGPIRSPRI